ncbi:MAG: DegV family protein [Streptococcaceae bacterium]|jgi:DegV family protein with EDD domain|nr:DegV family protein [Streptococcaceae bacterium]
MSSIKIVTDSSITIEEGLAEKLGITIVSLSFMIDGIVYQDSEVSGNEFMRMMAEGRTLPKTSQPPIGEFVEIYKQLMADGSSIISIHMSQSLSGTVEAARQASKLVEGDITVIDSGFTDQGLSFQVIEAAKLAQNGESKEIILNKIAEVKSKTKLYIGITNLDNLVKGGRISRLTGVMSNFLNVKIVMEFINGELRPIVKGRGTKAFMKWFEDWKNEVDFSQITALGISHANGLELSEKFKSEISSHLPQISIPVLDTGSIIATHTGPGAWAIMYY